MVLVALFEENSNEPFACQFVQFVHLHRAYKRPITSLEFIPFAFKEKKNGRKIPS